MVPKNTVRLMCIQRISKRLSVCEDLRGATALRYTSPHVMRASPSGKASASQADTRGFESRCPLQRIREPGPLRLRFFHADGLKMMRQTFAFGMTGAGFTSGDGRMGRTDWRFPCPITSITCARITPAAPPRRVRAVRMRMSNGTPCRTMSGALRKGTTSPHPASRRTRRWALPPPRRPQRAPASSTLPPSRPVWRPFRLHPTPSRWPMTLNPRPRLNSRQREGPSRRRRNGGDPAGTPYRRLPPPRSAGSLRRCRQRRYRRRFLLLKTGNRRAGRPPAGAAMTLRMMGPRDGAPVCPSAPSTAA